MPASENFLKFLCIFKKRRDGSGFEHYYNTYGNYDQEREFLGPVHGFKNWNEVQAGNESLHGGFVACQMRPRAEILLNPGEDTRYVKADYNTPFIDWKFALRHQPFELPGWVKISEIKKECIELLPEWASLHLIKSGGQTCSEHEAKVSLNNSTVLQTGGTLWAYGNSTVLQKTSGAWETFLHENSIGFIRNSASIYDHSRAELFPSGEVRAFGNSTIILRSNEQKKDIRRLNNKNKRLLYPDTYKNKITPPDHPVIEKRKEGKIYVYGPGVKIFRVRSGAVISKSQPVSDGDLIPVKINPAPEPCPFWNPESKSINMPFNMPVD